MGWWIQVEMVGMYRDFFALPGLSPRLHPDVALFGVFISVLFAVVGTWSGVRAAARLAPADAMRPPPPERGGRILLERIPALWQRVPFGARLVLRAVFRNPFRSLVGVLAAAVSTALVFTALSMVDALDYLMRYEFQRVAHQDFTVALRDPDAVEARAEVLRLPNVASTEPQLSVVSDLSRGPYRERPARGAEATPDRAGGPLRHRRPTDPVSNDPPPRLACGAQREGVNHAPPPDCLLSAPACGLFR